MVFLFSPIYPPYRGGGAEYIPWLQKIVKESARLEVVTESHPACPRHEVTAGVAVHRTWLSAANFKGPTLIRALRFAVQNVQYLGLMRHAVGGERRVLWFHGALFIHVSILLFLVRLVKGLGRGRVMLVLDLRDPVIPDRRLRRMTFFDETVSCCRRTDAKLQRCGFEPDSYRSIPVPLGAAKPARTELPPRLAQSGLEETRFFLAPHGVRDDKNFPLTFRIWRQLQKQGYSEKLVVVGSVRDWKPEYREQESAGALIVLGELRNNEVRMLMGQAALVFCIGAMEGLPRTALESIESGALVALPPDIPEFDEADHKLVISTTDETAAAAQVATIIEQEQHPRYSTAKHNEDAVAAKYRALLDDLYYRAVQSI